ncbi:hypothetical protein E8L90_03300 [Brevibacillus antibioticus]|uniref:Uncharacterized protein n=1 Tax=Brevibacillus antibioticus TaxID=2570228 RepID=A0A4U2Y2C0_9BACL|nr:hypothetical protein [Brevibacillus antibioticus]TKI54546.1 hypothetical protein E8L90_03300 [Brevibacillus antibioticus]
MYYVIKTLPGQDWSIRIRGRRSRDGGAEWHTYSNVVPVPYTPALEISIRLFPSSNGRITIHPPEQLVNEIHDVLLKDLGCQVTELLRRAAGHSVSNNPASLDVNMKYNGFIEIILPNGLTLKEVAYKLAKEGQSVIQSGDNFLITDDITQFSSLVISAPNGCLFFYPTYFGV